MGVRMNLYKPILLDENFEPIGIKSLCINCRFDLGNCAYKDQDEFVKICLHKIDKGR